jgi:hypothetical protein
MLEHSGNGLGPSMLRRLRVRGDHGLETNGRARAPPPYCVRFYAAMTNVRRDPRERVVLDVTRRCLVCDWEEAVTEPEETDVVGPLCSRCHAPSERIALRARRVETIARNPHAAALGRLGGLRGGAARAAALTPRRRREIARAAARARWDRNR